VYSFHASVSTFAEFWNNTYEHISPLTHCQTWAVFVQETIWQVAHGSNTTLELQDGLPVNDVARHAFSALGENGIIRSAEAHSCNECTHKYKRTADIITSDDPAAVVDLAAQDAAHAQLEAGNAMDIDNNPSECEGSPVKMVVLDGIVMGPTHCAFENCTQSIANIK
ncbi:hypothetical protein BDQ12DRAFT_754967, partial [Crucibulum laeve]